MSPIAEEPTDRRSAGAPAADAVMARADTENFAVASRLLPRRERAHLLAIYGFARLVDELGDSVSGDRLAALDWLEQELDRAFEGRAENPLLARLAVTLRECGLPREPFVRLIEANRLDQRVDRYESWEQLRGYCALSANPVGELVLGVFGAATPARVSLSDSICTALQLIEHCQDVAEDLAAGRVYLPQEDLERFGVTNADLGAERAGEPLRRTIAFEARRARALLEEGTPLIAQLNGRARLGVAAFIAGGHAALDAIERAGYDVLSATPVASRPRRALALARTIGLAGRRSPGASEAGVVQAYAHCEAVTRAEAANFFYGIRLLPRERRRAISAVYAFARRVDDIGDGALAHEEKLRLLDEEDRALAAVEQPSSGPAAADPVMIALADAYRRFPLPEGALRELIEGVRMDVNGVSYEHFEDLVLYCRRVAGGIGRVCLAIFGLREKGSVDGAEAERLADELGVAMQLTNILRDVREDAENGRVYLPAEDLRRFGLLGGAGELPASQLLASLAGGPGAAGDAHEPRELAAMVRFEAARARAWFEAGIAVTRLLDRRSAASVLAMAGIYRRLLDRIEAHPEEAARTRMSLPAREKAWVAVRSMLGGGA